MTETCSQYVSAAEAELRAADRASSPRERMAHLEEAHLYALLAIKERDRNVIRWRD